MLNNILNIIIIILIIVIIIYFINTLNNSNNSNNNNSNNSNNNNSNNIHIPFDSIGSKDNQITNFLAYVNEQKFCPNIYNSASSFWCMFPEKYGNGLLGKFCCTSCYYLTCKEIYCGDNDNGLYKLCKLSITDIKNLKKYYDSKNMDFKYPEQKLLEHIGDNVLKMKFNNIMYPIQIIKYLEDLNKHEKKPTIANSLYKESYKC